MNTVNNNLDTTNMTVEFAFEAITSALRRTTEGVLEAAKYIVQFEGREDFPQLKSQLTSEKVIAESTFSMYSTIGRCSALYMNIDKLPPSFNSIYHLAKLEKNTKGFIEDAIASGKLDRTTRLEEIRKWGETKPSEWVAITIEITSAMSVEMREKVKAAAIKAAKDLGATVKPAPVKTAAAKKEVA